MLETLRFQGVGLILLLLLLLMRPHKPKPKTLAWNAKNRQTRNEEDTAEIN